MSYGDWDVILKEYQEFYLKNPKTSDLVFGILKIIPFLREKSSFFGLTPGTSHATLFLEAPHKKSRIYVSYQKDFYTLYLMNPATDIIVEETRVPYDIIITTITDYMMKLLSNELD